MTKLCARGKSAAKRKFKVYPSAYANAYASKICAGKAKDPSGVRRKDWGPKKANKGLLAEKKTPQPSPGPGSEPSSKKFKDTINKAKKFRNKKPIPGDPRKKRKYLIDIQNPISEYDKKGKLKYTAANKGAEIKINKVIKGLKKASKLHAGQAKSLSTIKVRGGGMAMQGMNFKGVF